MPIPLRVIFIGESGSDAIAAELRRGGYEPAFQPIMSALQLAEALTTAWDIALSDFAVRESLDQIKKDHKLDVDYMRIRAYPFAHEIHDFVASHDRVYVVEQNRDAQLATLLKIDLPAEQIVKLRSILHYNGLPIDARTITDDILRQEAK